VKKFSIHTLLQEEIQKGELLWQTEKLRTFVIVGTGSSAQAIGRRYERNV
jgi:hypothetical protein